MGIHRLYSGDDGHSHLEELNLASHPELTSPLATSSITFREWPPGHFIDWHPAPRRQFVISLSGQIEIGLGDGTKVRYQPGDARLVEDTRGQGHTTRVIGGESCIHAVIPLND
jgi:quercetin dioxygenase-like cupin family protein